MNPYIKLCLVLFLSFAQPVYCTDRLSVLLDWYENPDHAPLLVAQSQGFFKQEGLDVELIGPADPTDPPKLIAADKVDIALDYQPQMLEQIDQGLPLLQIGTLIDKPLNALAVLQSSAIHTPADLKNKKIGLTGSGVNSILLKLMLKKHGLSLNDVQIINTHYDLTQALLSGKVDAVIGIMRNFELLQLALAGKPGRAFYPEDNGMPPYSELVFVINKNHQHDARFKRFLAAVKHATLYLHQHPETSWQAFAKSHPESNDELNHRAWFATLPYFANDPTQVDVEQLSRLAAFMHQA